MKTKTVKKSEMWRKYKGTTAEELCAAIGELWLAKSPNYIRMLNEVPNRLIKDIATIYGSRPTMPMALLEEDGVRHVENLHRKKAGPASTKGGRNSETWKSFWISCGLKITSPTVRELTVFSKTNFRGRIQTRHLVSTSRLKKEQKC
jgi:hypothetical protein